MTSLVNAERLKRDLVTVGASAGGVLALEELFARLPFTFPAVIAAVLHRSPHSESRLTHVLGRDSSLSVVEPHNGEAMRESTIYLAPRDQHMVVDDGALRLHRGPKVHFTRPAIDTLFRSAARTHHARVVGVLLTGGGDDGTDGLSAIKAAGGISIVQDPSEAQHPSMPLNAMLCDHVDLVLPLAEIAAHLVALANGSAVERRVH